MCTCVYVLFFAIVCRGLCPSCVMLDPPNDTFNVKGEGVGEEALSSCHLFMCSSLFDINPNRALLWPVAWHLCSAFVGH